MASRARFYLAVLGLQIFLIADVTFSLAQIDPTKTLIGIWEGQIEGAVPGGSERTMIINSVKAKGEGEWVGRGRFGVSGYVKEGPGGQEMKVSSKDNEIFVEFIAAAKTMKSPVRLKLVGDNKLDGTINMVLPGGRNADRRIRLEKVETKAGDVK